MTTGVSECLICATPDVVIRRAPACGECCDKFELDDLTPLVFGAAVQALISDSRNQRRMDKDMEGFRKMAKMKTVSYVEMPGETPLGKKLDEPISKKAPPKSSAKNSSEAEEPPEPEERKITIAEQELARRTMCRRHLLPFVMRFNSDYVPGWVHKDICMRLEKFSKAVANKESPRLMLFLPPRSGKSTLASIALPAWHLGQYPHHEFISTSYSGSLAMTFSRKVRQILRDPTYHSVFEDTQLDPDSQSVESWMTLEGGGYVAAGVGGGITGKGAHILTIDDPVRNQEEADSATTQETVYDWYRSTAYTRLAPGGGVLLIMTRWNFGDLAGKLIEASEEDGDQWEIIEYQAVATADEKYRDKGEALHPERYDLEALQRIRRTLGPRAWSALYQQRPTPDEGEYYNKSMLRFYDVAPPIDRMRIYAIWDLAIGQKQENDFTVGIVFGVDQDQHIYILHMERGKWGSLDIVDKMLDMFDVWHPEITGIERGHIELTLGPFLDKRIQERRLFMPYEPLKPGKRDKPARSRSIQGRFMQGMVHFPKRAEFTDDIVLEVLRFPNGVNDDICDVLAYIGLMLDSFGTVPTAKSQKKVSWRDRLPGLGRGRRRTAMSA